MSFTVTSPFISLISFPLPGCYKVFLCIWNRVPPSITQSWLYLVVLCDVRTQNPQWPVSNSDPYGSPYGGGPNIVEGEKVSAQGGAGHFSRTQMAQMAQTDLVKSGKCTPDVESKLRTHNPQTNEVANIFFIFFYFFHNIVYKKKSPPHPWQQNKITN